MAQSCERRVLLWGHSFIRRLGQYVSDEPSRGNFGLQSDCVSFLGYPGGTIDRLLSHLRSDIFSRRPCVVCLQIGGNDLSSPIMTPSILLSKFKTLIDRLLNTDFVQFVVICELFPRNRTRLNRGDVSVSVYNERVAEMNSLLASELEVRPRCKFWRHGRLSNSVRYYGNDGVHFANQHPYYKSIRGCILFSLSQVD